MRQVHKAGEKCFVDYAGKKPRIVDPNTGERVELELFVAVMGASNYTYAKVTKAKLAGLTFQSITARSMSWPMIGRALALVSGTNLAITTPPEG